MIFTTSEGGTTQSRRRASSFSLSLFLFSLFIISPHSLSLSSRALLAGERRSPLSELSLSSLRSFSLSLSLSRARVCDEFETNQRVLMKRRLNDSQSEKKQTKFCFCFCLLLPVSAFFHFQILQSFFTTTKTSLEGFLIRFSHHHHH